MSAVALVLISLSSAPAPASCAALAYCLAEAREALCERYPSGELPKALTDEEWRVWRLKDEMARKGCPVSEERAGCPAPPAAQAAPPVDCSKIAHKGETTSD